MSFLLLLLMAAFCCHQPILLPYVPSQTPCECCLTSQCQQPLALVLAFSINTSHLCVLAARPLLHLHVHLAYLLALHARGHCGGEFLYSSAVGGLPLTSASGPCMRSQTATEHGLASQLQQLVA
jgi:hypothetical protein